MDDYYDDFTRLGEYFEGVNTENLSFSSFHTPQRTFHTLGVYEVMLLGQEELLLRKLIHNKN